MDTVAPKTSQTYHGKHGVPFAANLTPEQVSLDDYDAIVIPGGQAPDRMRLNRNLVEIVRDANSRGKVIAAVCHGPQMLIEADIARGRRATSWPSVRTDLRNAGANVVDEAAVTDGNLVTSRSPDDLPEFCRAPINLLSKLRETTVKPIPA